MLIHWIITSCIAVTLCKYTAYNGINTATDGGSRMKDCVGGLFTGDTCFLVTGGAGFIGSNLSRYLLCKGFRVRVIDNLITGKIENIKDLLLNKSFEFVEGDCREYSICKKSCEGMDYVLHQAALGSVPRSIEEPIATHEANTTGTVNMLYASKEAKVKAFVYASSSSVYGDDKNEFKKEESIGMQLSPYAVSKRTCELYAKNFYDLYGLKTIGLRYFNVFGKMQSLHSEYAAVIPSFLKLILKGKPPTIYGDGEQARDFTYVDNVVIANIKACHANSDAWGKCFNVGCGSKTTINSLYKMLCSMTGFKESACYTEKRSGDVKSSMADLTRSSKILGYFPQHNIYEGLTLTLPWYQETLKE
jgi:UDP-N-acetylglucosamine 4-epimerase